MIVIILILNIDDFERDKAGAYGIQDGKASSFVTHIVGCYWNVTGFPIHAFCKHLLMLLKDQKL